MLHLGCVWAFIPDIPSHRQNFQLRGGPLRAFCGKVLDLFLWLVVVLVAGAFEPLQVDRFVVGLTFKLRAQALVLAPQTIDFLVQLCVLSVRQLELPGSQL